MANTRELRRRIKSVKNTSQITKAMQMVAATKMRRAQTQALASRPYDQTLSQSLSRLIAKLEEGTHPLLTPNDSKKVGAILFSTDKSLCGALNTNLFRAILTSQLPGNTAYFTIGRKGRDFVVKSGKDLQADFENSETVNFRQAAQIAKLVTNLFLTGELGEIYLIYPHFSSAIRQEPKIVKLLPIDITVTLNEVKGIYPSSKPQDDKVKNSNESAEFLFEPNIEELLDFILRHSIETKIYQALLETKASEHSARMLAMQNATDNAKELVSDLELSYNQIRQEGITRELLEITSASAALE